MIIDSDYLFVYGTLRPYFENSYAHYLRQHSHYVGEATFPGQLFDMGNYPGAIYQSGSSEIVLGTIYDIGQYKQSLLSHLDDYEGVSEKFKQPTEYTRSVIPVTFNKTIIFCWTYIYNLPTADKVIISSGDYEQYLNK